MHGLGGLVTPQEFSRLRRLNFGRGTLDQPINAETLARELGRYDPATCAEASRMAREDASVDAQAEGFETIYREALAEPLSADSDAELRAVAAWLQELLPPWQQWAALWRERESSRREAAEARSDAAEAADAKAAALAAVELAESARAGAASELDAARASASDLAKQVARQRAELASLRASPVWRLRDALLRVPGSAVAARILARRPKPDSST